MKTVKKVVNEETLEMEEVILEEYSQNGEPESHKMAILNALGCSPEEFSKLYKEYKDAEQKFRAVYDPFKLNLLSLYKDYDEKLLPKTISIGDAKLTYVLPSTRTSIDSKKLKEEEPDIARKYTKITKVDATIRLS